MIRRWGLAFLPWFTLAGCSDKPSPLPSPIASVKTMEVGEQAKGQIRQISGKLIAADESSLSFSVGGTVAEVSASAGETVLKGQVLARLETEVFELAVQNARAQLNIARAQLNERQQRFARFQQLLERDAVSRADFDVAEAELGTARGNLQAAQSSLEKAERDLNHTTLTAPFQGQLAERNIEPFQEITAGKAVFVIQSSDVLQVEVLVPETMIRDVDYGQLVQVRFPTLKDRSEKGIVAEIGSQVQAGNAFPVKVQVINADPNLRPGMSATVTFNFDAYLSGRDVYLIPLSAIALDLGARAAAEDAGEEPIRAPVFVYDQESQTVVSRQIEVGDVRGNDIEVFDGLQPGDRVVIAGVTFLRDNMPAQLWNPSQGLSE